MSSEKKSTVNSKNIHFTEGMVSLWTSVLIYAGGLEHEFYDFPHVGNVMIPIDFHIFQRGRYTTNQSRYLQNMAIEIVDLPSYKMVDLSIANR